MFSLLLSVTVLNGNGSGLFLKHRIEQLLEFQKLYSHNKFSDRINKKQEKLFIILKLYSQKEYFLNKHKKDQNRGYFLSAQTLQFKTIKNF